MKNSVKRVTKKSFENTIEDKVSEGYKIESRTDRQAVLVKPTYGGLLGHVLVFIFLGWWTIFLANILYLAYSYLANSEKYTIKIGDSE